MPYYLFQYPITRPITLRHFKTTFLVLGVVYVAFITLINVIAVGYENKSVISVAYNSTDRLWYEHLRGVMGGFPKRWNCSASTIKVTEGFLAAEITNESSRYSVTVLSWLYALFLQGTE